MRFTVSKGFLIYAQNTKDVDYIQQAYALALSIKYSQREIANVSLVTNDKVPKKYAKIFDQIIPVPWFKDVKDSPLQAENRWQLYYCTPYDETIVLDSDMLLLADISTWWDYCSNYDVKFCSKILNYKQELIEADEYHRMTFIANKLTNPYFALHYFKKNRTAFEFYKVLEFIINNWDKCCTMFAPDHYQKWTSMDLATAIAIEITGAYEYVTDNQSPMAFVHMKIPLQKWTSFFARWEDAVPFVLTHKGDLVVGNIKQPKLFHYVEKKFINNDLITQLEELAYGS